MAGVYNKIVAITGASSGIGEATALDRFGRLDVLVSNAGIAAALPVFRQQGEGHFVTIVSTSGLKIVPTQAVCAGTKNAVRTLLEAYAKSPPMASCAPRRCPRVMSVPNSSTTSRTPPYARRPGTGWPRSGSIPQRWPGVSPFHFVGVGAARHQGDLIRRQRHGCRTTFTQPSDFSWNIR